MRAVEGVDGGGDSDDYVVALSIVGVAGCLAGGHFVA